MSEPASPAPVAPAARSMRIRALGLLALLAVSVALAVGLTFPWPRNMLIGAVLLIPLALPVAGIVRSQRRTFAWGTLCVTPYFIYGCMELVANPELRVLATAILLASLGLAATLIAYLRLTRPIPADQEP